MIEWSGAPARHDLIFVLLLAQLRLVSRGGNAAAPLLLLRQRFAQVVLTDPLVHFLSGSPQPRLLVPFPDLAALGTVDSPCPIRTGQVGVIVPFRVSAPVLVAAICVRLMAGHVDGAPELLGEPVAIRNGYLISDLLSRLMRQGDDELPDQPGIVSLLLRLDRGGEFIEGHLAQSSVHLGVVVEQSCQLDGLLARVIPVAHLRGRPVSEMRLKGASRCPR